MSVFCKQEKIFRLKVRYVLFLIGVILVLYGCLAPDKSEKNQLAVITSGCDFLSGKAGCQLITSEQIKVWIPSSEKENIEILLVSLPATNLAVFKDNIEKVSSANQAEGSSNNSGKSVDFFSMNKQDFKLIHKNHGLFFETTIPPGRYQLTIKDSQKSAEWSLDIQKIAEPEWLKSHKLAIKSHQFESAINKLTSLLKTSNQTEKALILYYLARTYLANNNQQASIKYLNQSSTLFAENGISNKVIDNSTILIYIFLYLKDDAVQAKKILDSLPLAQADAKSIFYRDFYTAHLNSYLGELRLAESGYFSAKKIAQKFNLQREVIDTEHMHSRILVNSGKISEAISIREKIIKGIPESWNNCRKAKYYNGLGWAQNRLLETTKQQSDNSLSFQALKTSLRLLEASCPPTSPDRINVLINLAKFHYLKEHVAEARSYLQKVYELNTRLSYQQKLEVVELEALFELNGGNSDVSIILFEQLFQLADQVKYSDFLIKALVGMAHSHENNGDIKSAIEYYEKAEKLVFNNSLSIPVTGSQPNFLASKLNFSYRYVDLLSKNGKLHQAMTKARKFRSHWLESVFRMNQLAVGDLVKNQEWIKIVGNIKSLRKSIIAQQSLEWSLPYDQIESAAHILEEQKLKLAALFDESVRLVNSMQLETKAELSVPEADELFLFFYPVSSGWIGFAYQQNQVTSHTISTRKEQPLNSNEMAAEWISFFDHLVKKSKTVKIFPFGKMKDVDFRTIAYRDKNLFAYKNVLYGVDLKRLKSKIEAQKTFGDSLIVANSLGDLKETEEEAKSIATAVSQLNWRSKILTNNQAEIGAIKKSLQTVKHFHYAGHVFSSPDYLSQYQIPLAKNVSLNSTDILMLNRVPKWVVLSACNSSKSDHQVSAESLGLAHAFIISGSEQVIATTQPVTDKQASLLMTQFYQRWSSDENFSSAFRLAQLDLIKHQPEHDWLAFRVITL